MWQGPFAGTKYEDERWYESDPNYDKDRANHAVRFFNERLTHTKGRWAGDRFLLFPWQEHRIIRPLFGIVNPRTGKRQYRKFYGEIAKKNGKSETAAGVALILLSADKEPGPEVYSAACDRNQAGLVFDVAAQMTRQDRVLYSKLKIIDSTKRILAPGSAGFYRVMSSDVKTKHGVNAHGVIFDELHAQPTDELWKVLTKGSMDAREQPVLFVITTAGVEGVSVWRTEHDYCEQIMRGVIDNPEVLPLIYSLPIEEDWEDERNWQLVNPSMGEPGTQSIFSIDRMRADYLDSKNKPSELSMFRRLRLNQCVSESTRFIRMDRWRENGGVIDFEELQGKLCYGGLDLSTTTDLTAFWLVFPWPDGTKKVIGWCWIPEARMQEKIHIDKVPYDVWVQDGCVSVTTANGGETIDYQMVERQIMAAGEMYRIQEIMYDRYNSTATVQNLGREGLNMVQIGQGFLSMNAPTKYLEALYLEKRLHHGNNPVLNWSASNLIISMDAAGNIKPDKGKAIQRIDPMVAVIMALDGDRRREEIKRESIYKTRGLRTITRGADGKDNKDDGGDE